MHIHFCEWNNQGVFVALCCRTNKDLYPNDVCLPWSTRRRISIIGAHRHGWALHLPPATAIGDGDTVSSSGAAILILTVNACITIYVCARFRIQMNLSKTSRACMHLGVVLSGCSQQLPRLSTGRARADAFLLT